MASDEGSVGHAYMRGVGAFVPWKIVRGLSISSYRHSCSRPSLRDWL